MDQIGEEMLEWENILSAFSVALDSELSNFSENVENLQKRIKKIYFIQTKNKIVNVDLTNTSLIKLG